MSRMFLYLRTSVTLHYFHYEYFIIEWIFHNEYFIMKYSLPWIFHTFSIQYSDSKSRVNNFRRAKETYLINVWIQLTTFARRVCSHTANMNVDLEHAEQFHLPVSSVLPKKPFVSDNQIGICHFTLPTGV